MQTKSYLYRNTLFHWKSNRLIMVTGSARIANGLLKNPYSPFKFIFKTFLVEIVPGICAWVASIIPLDQGFTQSQPQQKSKRHISHSETEILLVGLFCCYGTYSNKLAIDLA